MKEIKGGLWKKVMVFFGFGDEEKGYHQRDGEKVMNLNHKDNIQILVLDPISFEEVRKVVDYLKGKRPIILNLHKTEKDQAKRIIDFVSGATYALQGNMQKIGDGIFLFTPWGVEISGEEIHDKTFWQEDWKRENH